jgi:hypothetical protein
LAYPTCATASPPIGCSASAVEPIPASCSTAAHLAARVDSTCRGVRCECLGYHYDGYNSECASSTPVSDAGCGPACAAAFYRCVAHELNRIGSTCAILAQTNASAATAFCKTQSCSTCTVPCE